jgi:hypothetical protein
MGSIPIPGAKAVARLLRSSPLASLAEQHLRCVVRAFASLRHSLRIYVCELEFARHRTLVPSLRCGTTAAFAMQVVWHLEVAMS